MLYALKLHRAEVCQKYEKYVARIELSLKKKTTPSLDQQIICTARLTQHVTLRIIRVQFRLSSDPKMV